MLAKIAKATLRVAIWFCKIGVYSKCIIAATSKLLSNDVIATYAWLYSIGRLRSWPCMHSHCPSTIAALYTHMQTHTAIVTQGIS